MKEKTILSYDNVCLLPNYSVVKSRSECDTSYTDIVTGLSFKVPVIPANMKCCIDLHVASFLSASEYFYSMHRFGDTLQFIKHANRESWRFISISIGVKAEDYDLLKTIKLEDLRVDCITVDIAHGHSVLMWEMLQFINSHFLGKRILVIGGNVCTPKACIDLKCWGADMVKVGIAQGGACTTFGKTGFGTPMFTTVLECANTKVPIIADGGVRSNGDISKAIAAGAKLVMAGSMFASCIDSPTETIREEIKPNSNTYTVKKVYFGSASKFNKGGNRHIEGTQVVLDSNGMTYDQKFMELQDDISSAISYAGGKNLESLTKVEWRIIKCN